MLAPGSFSSQRSDALSSPDLGELSAWKDQLVSKVVGRLQERIYEFARDPAPGVMAISIQEQKAKFAFLTKLIEQHKSYSRGPGDRHSHSFLHRIINGFIVEFIKQSEGCITSLNVENDRNPEAKKYWDSQDPDVFNAVKLPGMFHFAVTYNRLRESPGKERKNQLDIFQAEFSKFQSSHESRASLYNDYPKNGS
jgi:hypothetical protein